MVPHLGDDPDNNRVGPSEMEKQMDSSNPPPSEMAQPAHGSGENRKRSRWGERLPEARTTVQQGKTITSGDYIMS